MAKTLTEKSIALFEAETLIGEKIDAYKAIKEKVTKDLIEHQKNLQEKADEAQSLIDRISGV
jgi:hypothetical protein